ncbi:hypothetical protein A8990_109140 [Paenibacillus taihuensis]|uniref:Uncharacterized protein n=1 Tax=Paenibacillus taihuensis TaxID=1156355 RepID=A0A3D9S422_9BACL|nr:hypothetical protein [Paenibacillus taihuensis]REE87494.1 hypothetical protein A8990_109140 [Paenibacillus taihuensis]
MSVSRILKWVSGGIEVFLGIPIIGGLFVISMAWTPLFFMLVLHIVTLVFCSIEKKPKHGSILGIITSVVAWIPVVGMIMHIITAILLMVSAAKDRDVISPPPRPPHPPHPNSF